MTSDRGRSGKGKSKKGGRSAKSGTKGSGKGRSRKKGSVAGKGKTESRKADHVKICKEEDVVASHNYWDDIFLVHNALPEVDRDDIDMGLEAFGRKLDAPVIIAAMTGGYDGAKEINENIARVAADLGLGIGVGSQRAALEDPSLEPSFQVVGDYDVPLVLGNLGVPQAKDANKEYVKRAMDMVDAHLLCIHLNFAQEIVQPEGDTEASGCLGAIARIAGYTDVIAKETGAGISKDVARALVKAGVRGIDVGGLGGTSFSAVEVHRAKNEDDDLRERLGRTFWDWGIPTPVSVLTANVGAPLIATGGIRTGLDAAKGLAMGASLVGMAGAVLTAASQGYKELKREMECVLAELRGSMFLTGSSDLHRLKHARYILTGPTAAWIEQLG